MKQFGNAGEVFFLVRRKTRETLVKQPSVGFDEDVVMNAIVADVLARETAKAQTNPHPLTLIALFYGLGFAASLIMAAMGFDLGAAFF
jgi:hypothetical protein